MASKYCALQMGALVGLSGYSREYLLLIRVQVQTANLVKRLPGPFFKQFAISSGIC